MADTTYMPRTASPVPADRHAPGTLVFGPRAEGEVWRPKGRVHENKGHRALVGWTHGANAGTHSWVANADLVTVF